MNNMRNILILFFVSISFFALSQGERGIPSGGVSGQVLQISSDSVNLEWEYPSSSSFNYYFFQNASSDITGYKQMIGTYTNLPESYVTDASPANTNTIVTFATNSDFPGKIFIPSGIWSFHIHAYRTGGSKNVQIYANIYTRTTGGTETLIGTTGLSSNLTTTESDLGALNSQIDNIFINTTDRIVVKVIESITGSGSNPTSITVGFSNETAAGLQFPNVSANVTNFVPYIGSTSDLVTTYDIYANRFSADSITSPTSNVSFSGKSVKNINNLTAGSTTTSRLSVGGISDLQRTYFGGAVNYALNIVNSLSTTTLNVGGYNTYSITVSSGTITALTTALGDGVDNGIGAERFLFFKNDGIVLTHSTNLQLPASASYTTQAGDRYRFIQIDTASASIKWLCTEAVRADGTQISTNITASSFAGYNANNQAVSGAITFSNTASVTWSAIGTAPTQTFVATASTGTLTPNAIYVTSTGSNVTGTGSFNSPYATVEYALSNTVNTGTLTVVTTNGTATLTGVASTTNIAIGQYITGTGIPYNTIVTAFTSSTIVCNQNMTASGTVTGTWTTPYEIVIYGNHTAASNWYKSGFWINATNANINFGAIGLFTYTTTPAIIPMSIKGGNWYGTATSSQFINTDQINTCDLTIDINTYFSKGTGYQIYGALQLGRNVTIRATTFDARFGKVLYADCQTQSVVSMFGYYYGLLEGIKFATNGFIGGYFNGNLTIETPANINALLSGFAVMNVNANIIGQLYCNAGGSGNITGTINGTTHSFYTYTGKSLTVNAYITGAVTISASQAGVLHLGQVKGDVTSTFNGTLKIDDLIGAYSESGEAKAYISGSQNVGNTSAGIGNITLSGTETRCVITAQYNSNTPYTYGYKPAISVASGCTLTIVGSMYGNITSCAGTIVNTGTFYHINKCSDITGKLINNGNIELIRSGAEGATTTPCLSVSTGIIVLDGGQLTCAHADSKSGLIRKTASGGKLVLKGQCYLKVANGLAPLQILSNTGTAQDVMDFSWIDNGAVGYRLASTFSDTTYGTAYAPNLTIGGTGYEATTNDF